jgi:hypothetical protein
MMDGSKKYNSFAAVSAASPTMQSWPQRVEGGLVTVPNSSKIADQ